MGEHEDNSRDELGDRTEDAPRRPAVVYDAAVLFQGRREVFIDHAGQRYRLRMTRAGKLHLLK